MKNNEKTIAVQGNLLRGSLWIHIFILRICHVNPIDKEALL